MGEVTRGVTQGVEHLKAFDVAVPILTTADGAVYVPMRWLCDLFGLAPAHWIGSLCSLYRGNWGDPDAPESVRRLPYEPQDGAARAEWCLEWNRALQWMSFHLDIRQVPAGKRYDQLTAFREQVFAATSALYHREQVGFHSARRDLIEGLQDVQKMLELLERLERSLDSDIERSGATSAEGRANRVALSQFFEQGRQHFLAAADALRATLQEMLRAPVVDAMKVDEAGSVIDTAAMPLVPYTPDMSEIAPLMHVAGRWLDHELPSWLQAHGIDASAELGDYWPGEL